MPDRIRTASRSFPGLIVLVAVFLLLAIVYSIATPIFEAGDEIWHYPFVRHLATGNGLPVQDPAVKTLWAQEGGQPPLYYALGALATAWIDTQDLPDRLWINPEAKIGIPLVYGNKNMVVHTSAEDFPWHNTTLAVHLLRFLSIVLSAGTVLLTALLALEIGAGKRLALVAAALVAFNPMFLFISASVNNDNLAVLLATLSLWLLARLVTRGPTRHRFITLGLVLGLAVLSKVSDLGLLGVAALVFLYLAKRAWDGSKPELEQNARIRARDGNRLASPLAQVVTGSLLCGAIVVAVAGWWYLRNGLLYGDPLAFNVWVDVAGGRPAPATLGTLLAEFQGFRISFWGNFGAVNIIAADWVYTVLDVLTVLAAAGLLAGLARGALPRLLLLPAFWLALICAGLVRWTLLTLASQGRLIFPALSAVAILLAFGLEPFSLRHLRGMRGRLAGLEWAVVLFLFGVAVLVPFAVIAPVYALPSRLPAAAAVPNPVHITFDHRAELVGYDLPERSVNPGEDLPIILYWQAKEQMDEDWSVYIRLFDARGNIIARWDAFPGRGLYPTRVWQPGGILVDPYRIPVAPDASGPGVGRIEAGLFRRVPLETLTARDPAGQAITPTIARFKIKGESAVQVENPVEHNFGGKIALVGYAVGEQGDSLRVRLYWRALASIEEDYTVFVHLVDASGERVAQNDDEPQQGAYPTRYWDVGETIVDEHVLPLPRDRKGDYAFRVGLYRGKDGTRLPVDGGRDTYVSIALPLSH